MGEAILKLPPETDRVLADAADYYGVKRLPVGDNLGEVHGPPVSGTLRRLDIKVVLELTVVLVRVAEDVLRPEKLVEALVEDVLQVVDSGTRQE